MVVSGRAIAADIFAELKNQISHLDVKPHLTVFTCAPDFATQSYLQLKKQKAEEIGVQINVIELPETVTTEDMIASVSYSQMQTDGIIVQLPLPAHLDTDRILAAIPPTLDVDVVHYDGTAELVLPPVVGAIAEIVRRHDILLATQNAVVMGQGRLVGKPTALWLARQGVQVQVVTEHTPDAETFIANADILVLGVGKPGLVKPLDVKKGVVIFDAGTSEEKGRLKGDADGLCADKASVMTPVPGGIGPITVAILLRNLVTLAQARQ